jgi:hypothetical protein
VPMRICLTCNRIFRGTGSRCPEHATTHERRRNAARDAVRGSSAARGYGTDHRREREEWRLRIRSGEPVYCWRCGLPITADMSWALGHVRDDRDGSRHPEHVNPCIARTRDPGRITSAAYDNLRAPRRRPQ